MTRASDISNTAAEWLMRLEAQSSPQMWEAFQAWLDADTRHRAAFIRLRVMWHNVDALKSMRPEDGTIDADLLTRSRLQPDRVAALGPHPLEGNASTRPDYGAALLSRRRVLALAAGVAAAGTLAWLGRERIGWSSYETTIGGREQVTLADGTVIDLNTNTALRVRLSRNRRAIELTRGEALFHVAPDSQRPFFVRAASTVVRAVGTEFSVRIRDPEHVEVLVAEGRIAVGTSGSTTDLVVPAHLAAAPKVSADEAATVQRNAVAVRRMPSGDIIRKLEWTAGQLHFQGETLGEAVQEFNRYNKRQLTIADPAIVAVQVGGIFRATELDSFVAVLQHSFGIRAQPINSSGDLRLIAEGMPPP